jgi:hypothetical protein
MGMTLPMATESRAHSVDEAKTLVDRFVASFEKLSQLETNEILDPVAWQLAIGERNQFGYKQWRPSKVSTDRAMLERVYSSLPARFPPLFELLLLSYRWAKADLRRYALLANPPGHDLSGFLEQISSDRAIWKCLTGSGYLQFGSGPDIDYDPVCFDLRSRNNSADCRIVKIDHEQILCNAQAKITAELAPSFEQLMLRAIEFAG